MPIQLKAEEIALIKSLIQQQLPMAEIYLFGSRTTGKAKAFSDIDILIKNKNKIPLATLTLLKEALAETDIPYMVDIIDWHRTTEEFRESIGLSKI